MKPVDVNENQKQSKINLRVQKMDSYLKRCCARVREREREPRKKKLNRLYHRFSFFVIINLANI